MSNQTRNERSGRNSFQYGCINVYVHTLQTRIIMC